MEHWDQDIHRIQEIHQLLVDRQRYFRGHLNTSCYKLDHNGNPLFFPKLHSTNKGLDSNEPSQGHSVEANFGTTDTGGDNPSVSLLEEDDEIKLGSGALSDSSDGNRADQSQNECSDTSDDMRSGKEVAKKKVKKKSPKVLRKWVAKNLEIASGPSVYDKPNASALDSLGSRKSSILRFKAVSFDGNSIEPSNELLNEVVLDESASMLSPTLMSKRKQTPNPINLLRRKSWILKAEITSRLNEDASALNLNKVITGLTKSSISHAREKLKKAEKSLRATVKNEDIIPAYKKKDKQKPEESKNVTFSSVPKPKPLNKKPDLSRLALRQQEEALRSDLNLREAFALIKIDPDPLLDLASVETESKLPIGRRTSLVGETGNQEKADDKFSRKGSLDDSKTTYSLQRLTKLSVQHLQKQHSLIPFGNIVPPLRTQKGTKEMEKLGKVKSENLPFQGNKGPSKPDQFSRRKSSTPSTNSGQQKIQFNNNKQRFREFRNERTTKIQIPLPGNKPETMGRVERRQSRAEQLDRDIDHYTLDRLASTVV